MMDFERTHKFAIIPPIILCLFSALSILLTTVYWILGDWIIGRWIPVPSAFPEKDRFPIDDVLIEYTEPSTNATIVSGCLNLTAAVFAIVAWRRLRNHELDSDFNAPLRRFYVLATYITGTAGCLAALASIILHYTDKGNDKYGCTTTVGYTAQTPAKGVPFTNLLCSRELGACNVIRPHLTGKDYESAAAAACNTAVAVKWLQLILILFSVALMAMFFFGAKVRRQTRWSLHSIPPVDSKVRQH